MAVTGKLTGIEDALSYRLSTLTLSPARRVAWPGKAFVPAVGEVYLEPSFMPNRSDFAAVGANSPRRHRGLYQVQVKGPINAGPQVTSEIADLIVEHFNAQTINRNSKLVRIGSFDGSPAVPSWSRALDIDGWRVIPVTIPWWCDTSS